MGLLDSVLGGSATRSGSGMSPITMAFVGLLAYRTLQGKGRLAEMLGRRPSGANPYGGNAGSPSPDAGDSSGGLGGLLGGLLGGAGAGSVLSSGLSDLLKQFQQNGQGDKAESWIACGRNKHIAPSEVERALGGDKVAWLMQETGLSREQLLTGLSHELPQAVDKLTPKGRIPSQQEAARLM